MTGAGAVTETDTETGTGTQTVNDVSPITYHLSLITYHLSPITHSSFSSQVARSMRPRMRSTCRA